MKRCGAANGCPFTTAHDVTPHQQAVDITPQRPALRRPGAGRDPAFRFSAPSSHRKSPTRFHGKPLVKRACSDRYPTVAFPLTLHGMRQPCVYLLASHYHGTLYAGVTSHLIQRVWQHRNDCFGGFTKRYRVHTLVWYEAHEDMYTAIVREKAIKRWHRAWKIRLIEAMNPQWKDLYPSIL
jgi:putative endonuclease